MPDVRLTVNGLDFGGWESVSFTKSIEAIASKFSLRVSDLPGVLPIAEGDACRLMVDGKKLLDGYVDAAAAQIADGEHGIDITGRDKCCDLVDCGATNPAQEFLNIGFADLLHRLAAPFGVKVAITVPGLAAFPKFSLQQETAFEAIERACRLRGVLAMGDGSGGIQVVAYGTKRAGASLVLGQNVKRCEITRDNTDRFSEYIVYGQHPGGNPADDDGATVNAVQGRAVDSSVKRYRPCIIVAEGAVTPKTARDRAQWEAAVRAARAVTCKVELAGWFETEGGDFWDVNKIVSCDFSALGIKGDFLIKDVQLTLSDDEGTICMLTLTKKDAYLKQPDQKDEKSDPDKVAKRKKLKVTRVPSA